MLQELTAKRFGFHRQQSALPIGQQKPASTELFAQHLILGTQVIDYLLLLPIDPSGQDHSICGLCGDEVAW